MAGAKRWLWVLFGLALLVSPAAGKSLPREQVPEPLKPWIGWVLHGHEEASCPAAYHDAGERRCQWPGELELRLDSKGGSFTQEWELFSEGAVPLPVGDGHWPTEVRSDGKAAPVIAQEERPAVRLGVGRHRLEGRFSWSLLPEYLAIPPATGLVVVTVNGEKIPPRLDEDGKLWLKGGEREPAELENRLQVQVFRKLTDDIPPVLATQLVLEVSGRSRELLLGRALPSGFAPAALKSPLPIRIEPDGRLRIQVRPGRWVVELTARHQGPLTELALEASGEPLSLEEIWVFEARPHFRLVEIEGAPGIDPQQTGLPAAWRRFPAFVVAPGAKLVVKEKRRGDPDPVPDQLSLERSLWLDFDGGGFTLRDRIHGAMTRSWRLELLPPGHLGRVSIDGADRFITRDRGQPGTGVELRRGQLNLVADSRLENRGLKIPATGWDQDFVNVRATLNLPPGWRLLHASGADQVPGTWITQWSLLDLFVVLLVAMAALRLWGWRWGLVALISLALAYHEPGAPRWIWVHLLVAVALVRVLPPGRFRLLAGLYRNLALAALLVLLLPFMVEQVRCGIYPQLERPGMSLMEETGADAELAVMADRMMETAPEPYVRSKSLQMVPSLAKPPAPKVAAPLPLHDPNAMVQTGPGLPQWRWRSIPIRWNGPVQASQQLQLILLSPEINLILAFARVLLLAALAWLMLDSRRQSEKKWSFTPHAGWLPLLVFGLAVCAVPVRADFPNDELLGQLRERLLAPADCFPHCAECQGLSIRFSPERLFVELTFHAEAGVSVPLPGQRNQWLPERVRLDDKPALLYRQADGSSWIALTPGSHQVTMEGPLPNREAVILSLPLPPRKVTASGQGWELEGLNDRGFPGSQLQLRRLAKAGEKKSATLEPATLPSYFRLERTVTLGLRWQVSTSLVRVFKGGSAAVIRVPLLAGEAVTSEGFTVADGLITLHVPADVDRIGWESVLEMAPQLVLTASGGEVWSESWKVDAGPIWHLETAGIPVVHHQDPAGNRLLEWRPWPGEQLTLNISRPEGVAGKTLTIDDSLLTVRPGGRATEYRLALTWRSSRGGQHSLKLPERAELQGVTLDGIAQPIRQEGRIVTIPLTPGGKRIELSWLAPQGIETLLRTAAVDVGADSVNARIRLELPRDRWTLFAGGPRLGPAVLFWGVLLVLIPVAVGLGLTALTPLKLYHWLLLGIGLTQLPPINALLVVGWLLALGLRSRITLEDRDKLFNLCQAALAVLTAAALYSLVVSVQQGLLGSPQMQIVGNGSSANLLNWYQDRASAVLPQAWIWSLPMAVYRLLMLAWALWLAFSLLRWLQWGWRAVSTGGLWRPVTIRRKLMEKAPPAPGSDPGGPSS